MKTFPCWDLPVPSGGRRWTWSRLFRTGIGSWRWRRGGRWRSWREQAARHRPELVAVAGREEARKLQALLPAGVSARIVTGREGLEEAAAHEKADVVVGGLVGALGLRSAYAAAAAGKRLALANKETLVVAGELILSVAAKSGAEIVPVDSEHCAIHQALRCGERNEVERLVLTASGGPFRQRDLFTFDTITVEDALAHPTWKMGPKITVDSATMMNKGLEIIEAHFLFGLSSEKIAVVIHPQSIVHSFVEFVDGSLRGPARPERHEVPDPLRALLPRAGAQRLRAARPGRGRPARLLRSGARALPRRRPGPRGARGGRRHAGRRQRGQRDRRRGLPGREDFLPRHRSSGIRDGFRRRPGSLAGEPRGSGRD